MEQKNAGATTTETTTSEAPAGKADALAAGGHSAPVRPPVLRLGNRFRLLWLAALVASLGAGISEIALPWLASSLTRDPLLIAAVTIALELPWLLLSLPAGAVIDRSDTKRVISATSLARAVVMALIAVAIVTDTMLLGVLALCAFLIGSLQVAGENADQTFLPQIVPSEKLERANSTLAIATSIAGSFAGPWIGGLLLSASLGLPFVVEAAAFAVATVLVLLIRAPRKAARAPSDQTLRADLVAGVRYFWQHRALRSLGLLLGFINLSSGIAFATQVLFAQEVLGLSSREFGALFSVGAVGGLIGAQAAPWLERRYGARIVLLVSLGGNALAALVIGVTSSGIVVGAAVAVAAGLALTWNIITISYRQRIVPEHLLGRVNSIYRLFAWGPLPLGSLLGGALVKAGESVGGREFGLRTPLFFAAAITAVAFAIALLKLRSGIWARGSRGATAEEAEAAPADSP